MLCRVAYPLVEDFLTKLLREKLKVSIMNYIPYKHFRHVGDDYAYLFQKDYFIKNDNFFENLPEKVVDVWGQPAEFALVSFCFSCQCAYH